jgi:hypothetical protein
VVGYGVNLNINEMEEILISYAESVSLKKGEKIPLNLATDFLSRFFYYDETQGFLYLKNNPNLTNPITVQDVLLLFSQLGFTLSEHTMKTALATTKVERRSLLSLQMHNLPQLDLFEVPIEKLALHFKTNDDKQFEWFLKYWMANAAGQVMAPNDIQAVNRLVLCLQSETQRIGKTSFFRWLAEPFTTETSTAIQEYDRPDFSKDGQISYSSNLIVLLDDIDSWSGSSLQKMKSIISQKRVKARPPYGSRAVDLPRTSSFAATTNSFSFLEETGNTRWVVFEVTGIDRSYSQKLNPKDLWSQAKALWTQDSSYRDMTEDKIAYVIESNKRFIHRDDADEMILSHLEFDESARITATQLYWLLPREAKDVLGHPSRGISNLGKLIAKNYNPRNVSVFSGGRKLYKLQIA